jgi:hypothetical protein
MSVIFNIGIGNVKKRNIKTIRIAFSEPFLKLVRRTPALNQLFPKSQLDSFEAERLHTINVNNYIYSRLKNLENDENFVIIE